MRVLRGSIVLCRMILSADILAFVNKARRVILYRCVLDVHCALGTCFGLIHPLFLPLLSADEIGLSGNDNKEIIFVSLSRYQRFFVQKPTNAPPTPEIYKVYD